MITLTKSTAASNTRVIVSGLIARGDNLEYKRTKTSYYLREICQEEHVLSLELETIDAQKDLNNSKIAFKQV